MAETKKTSLRDLPVCFPSVHNPPVSFLHFPSGRLLFSTTVAKLRSYTNSTSTQHTDIQRESSLLMHLFQVVHIKRREGLASRLRERHQAKSSSYAMLHLHTDKAPSTIRTTRPVPTTHHPAHIDKACTGRGRTEAH